MEPQNNGFFHRLTHKTMVVSVDENGNPTKVIEKKRSLILVWIICTCFWFMFYIFTNEQ